MDKKVTAVLRQSHINRDLVLDSGAVFSNVNSISVQVLINLVILSDKTYLPYIFGGIEYFHVMCYVKP